MCMWQFDSRMTDQADQGTPTDDDSNKETTEKQRGKILKVVKTVVLVHTNRHGESVWAAVSLRDDFRAYLPELLPRFIGLFAEAERSGSYDQVPAALHALEALGGALEDHLQLLLPALVRLICIGKRTQKCSTCNAAYALIFVFQRHALLGDCLLP